MRFDHYIFTFLSLKQAFLKESLFFLKNDNYFSNTEHLKVIVKKGSG